MPKTEIVNLKDFSRDTPVEIEMTDQVIRASVADVLQWIAPGAPPHEALKFLMVCRVARLNPFLNEAYLVQMGPKWGTIIAKGGYLKRAEEHPDFDGYEAGIVVQRYDPRTADKARVGDMVELVGEIVPVHHLLVGGWARVWKRGRTRPYYRRVAVVEYAKDTQVWKTIPCTMIRKVALVGAIREAFSLSDSFDEAEVEPVSRNQVVAGSASLPGSAPPATGLEPPSARLQLETTAPAPAGDPDMEVLYDRSPDPHLPPAKLARAEALVREAGMPAHKLDEFLAARGARALADLSPAEADYLIDRLEHVVSRRRFVDGFPHPAPDPPPGAPRGGMPVDAEILSAPVIAGHAAAPADEVVP